MIRSERDGRVLELMEKYGGSFVKALAECFRRADHENTARLHATFPEYWKQYETMADREASERGGA